jgi:hypothetical protein
MDESKQPFAMNFSALYLTGFIGSLVKLAAKKE